MPSPNALVRTGALALNAARIKVARITLMGVDRSFVFKVVQTGEDGSLIGHRLETPGNPAVIPYHALAVVEYEQ